MLLEALVIGVCAGGYSGCNQATSAYYDQSKDLQAINRRVQNYGKHVIGDRKWIIYVGTPAYELISRQPAKILIYKGTTLNLDPWKQEVGIQWNY